MKLLLKRIIFLLKNRKKNIILSKGANVSLNCLFEGNNYIGKKTSFVGSLGKFSYIGDNSNINGKIGCFSCISHDVVVVNGFHPLYEYASIHPLFYSKENSINFSFENINEFNEYRFADNKNKYYVEIGNDVWIGQNVTILAGIKIGDGAVIGAGAVVTKDVLPYTIVGGNPAKVIKKRFDEKTIESLLELKWWDKSMDWLEEHSHLFNNVNEIIKK